MRRASEKRTEKLNCPLRSGQREPADYFPPVFRTPRGLMEQSPISNPEYLQRHPDARSDPETLNITPGVPIRQDPAALLEAREPALREVYAGM